MKKIVSTTLLGTVLILSGSNIFADAITCPGAIDFIKGLSNKTPSPLDSYWRLPDNNNTGFMQFYLDADPSQDSFPTGKKLYVEIMPDHQISCEYGINKLGSNITHSINTYNVDIKSLDMTKWTKTENGGYRCHTTAGASEKCAVPVLSKIDF